MERALIFTIFLGRFKNWWLIGKTATFVFPDTWIFIDLKNGSFDDMNIYCKSFIGSLDRLGYSFVEFLTDIFCSSPKPIWFY